MGEKQNVIIIKVDGGLYREENPFFLGNIDELTELKIPEGIIVIGNGAFQNFTKLEKVVVGKSVNTILFDAFKGCKKLKEVIIEKGSKLDFIDDGAFADCKELKKVDFSNCKKPIYVSDGVFNGCTSLEEVVFPKNITHYSQKYFPSTFKGCKKLKKITILSKNRSIDYIGGIEYGQRVTLVVPKTATSLIKNLEQLKIEWEQPQIIIETI